MRKLGFIDVQKLGKVILVSGNAPFPYCLSFFVIFAEPMNLKTKLFYFPGILRPTFFRRMMYQK